jgi:hypothetical protein
MHRNTALAAQSQNPELDRRIRKFARAGKKRSLVDKLRELQQVTRPLYIFEHLLGENIQR